MITQLTKGAQLWAGGTFRGFEDWVAEHEVEVVANLLGRQHVRVGQWAEWNMNEINHVWWENLTEIMEMITTALYSRKHVLVHRQHGVHRTGSLITCWLAL